MAENKHSGKQTEKDRGLSRMIIIILTAAAVCLLLMPADFKEAYESLMRIAVLKERAFLFD